MGFSQFHFSKFFSTSFTYGIPIRCRFNTNYHFINITEISICII